MHRRRRVAGPGGRAGRWSEGGAVPSHPAPQSGRGATRASSRLPHGAATASPADLHGQDTAGAQPAAGLNKTLRDFHVCAANRARAVIPNPRACFAGRGAELVQSPAVDRAERRAAGEQCRGVCTGLHGG